MLTCIDCGRKMHWDEAVAIQMDGKTAYICQRCARYALTSIRNPLYVCSYCGAKIYTIATPRFCPKCKKPWRGRNPNKAVKLAKLSMKPELTTTERKEFQKLSLEVKPLEYKEALLRILPKNPIRYVDGWQYGTTGKIYPRKEQALRQMRAIHWARGRRNPTSITEAVGNMLGGLGILSIPLFIGLILWIQSKAKE